MGPACFSNHTIILSKPHKEWLVDWLLRIRKTEASREDDRSVFYAVNLIEQILKSDGIQLERLERLRGIS